MTSFNPYAVLLVILACVMASSCTTINNAEKYKLKSDYYRFKQTGGQFKKVYVSITEDTAKIIPIGNSAPVVRSETDEIFIRRGIDVDVLVVPFKYRPSSSNLPRQLTAEFNGNIFLGYRVDRFHLHYSRTPGGLAKQLRHMAVTAGAFAGIGSASITPWTTNYQTTDEYNGFILSRGFAVMMGVNNLTVGVGLGWDYLTDRDKNIWIYQNKPWTGLILSLNLN